MDGVTKETYGENLSENLDDLLKRMKQFSYKPYPVRRAYIPKGKGRLARQKILCKRFSTNARISQL